MPTFEHPALPQPGVRPLGRPLVWLTLAGLGLALTAYLWSQPGTTATEVSRPLRATYVFDHTGALPDNPVYESDRLRLGDPIFLAIVDEVEVTVDYLLGTPADTIELAEGWVSAQVSVESSAGWQRTVERTDPVPIADGRAQLAVGVDLAQAQELAEEIDAATGIGGDLTVRVRAEAAATGQLTRDDLGSVAIDERSGAEVAFALGASTAELVAPPRSDRDRALDAVAGIAPGTAAALGTEAGTEQGGATPAGDPEHPGRREVVTMVTAAVTGPARISMLGQEIDLTLLRVAISLLTGLAVLLAAHGLWAVARANRGGAVAAIAAEHHAELVPASGVPPLPPDRIIDLARFEDLLRIGRELELPVVVWSRGDIVSYSVTDGLTRYRFETPADAPRHGTTTVRSVTTRPGRRADDPPGSMVVIDRPVPAADAPLPLSQHRRLSDVAPNLGGVDRLSRPIGSTPPGAA
ncbi:MAG: hypothetical protein ACLFS9_01025 [Nitriliruptoraceae bacterium]